jgi:GLPGLI family protein
MKKSFLFLLASVSALIVWAQDNTTGTVKYEQVVKLEIKLEGDAAQFADMLPKERKSNKVLYFNPKASLYENGEKAEDQNMSMSSGSGNVMIRMEEPENKIFTDLEKKSQLEQREFMTRVFLIEGEINQQWKLTGNQKMILDYPCQEAVMEKDSSKIVAWFTPVIPVSAGPSNLGGLPGLILSVEKNDGKETINATSVEFATVPNDKIEKPDKGKKVTREEFDKIVEEKMKEMGAEGGAGGQHMMIRIQK